MSTDSTPLVGALDEPTVKVRSGFIAVVVLANFGIMLAFYAPILNLLPRLAEQISPDNKESTLGWILGAGAFASIIFNPLAGALSDRTTSAWGRRKPWVLVGSLLGALGLVAFTFGGGIAVLAVLWFACRRPSTRRTPVSPRPSPTRSPSRNEASCRGSRVWRRRSASSSASRS